MIENPTLPEGWTSEAYRHDCTVIHRKPYGLVTIDWTKRGFRSGVSSTGRLTSTAKYMGRGWRQRLVADAVQSLRDIWKDGAP